MQAGVFLIYLWPLKQNLLQAIRFIFKHINLTARHGSAGNSCNQTRLLESCVLKVRLRR